MHTELLHSIHSIISEQNPTYAYRKKCHTWYVLGMHCLYEIRKCAPRNQLNPYLYWHCHGNLLAKTYSHCMGNTILVTVEQKKAHCRQMLGMRQGIISQYWVYLKVSTQTRGATINEQGVSGFCERLWTQTHNIITVSLTRKWESWDRSESL